MAWDFGKSSGMVIRARCPEVARSGSFGKNLKSGAYVSQLTRTRIGKFELSQAIDIQEFTDSFSLTNNLATEH